MKLYNNITFLINSNDNKNTNPDFISLVIQSINQNYKISTAERLKYTFYDIFNYTADCKPKLTVSKLSLRLFINIGNFSSFKPMQELETFLKEKLASLKDQNFDVEFETSLNDALNKDLIFSLIELSNFDGKTEEMLFEEASYLNKFLKFIRLNNNLFLSTYRIC